MPPHHHPTHLKTNSDNPNHHRHPHNPEHRRGPPVIHPCSSLHHSQRSGSPSTTPPSATPVISHTRPPCPGCRTTGPAIPRQDQRPTTTSPFPRDGTCPALRPTSCWPQVHTRQRQDRRSTPLSRQSDRRPPMAATTRPTPHQELRTGVDHRSTSALPQTTLPPAHRQRLQPRLLNSHGDNSTHMTPTSHRITGCARHKVVDHRSTTALPQVGRPTDGHHHRLRPAATSTTAAPQHKTPDPSCQEVDQQPTPRPMPGSRRRAWNAN